MFFFLNSSQYYSIVWNIIRQLFFFPSFDFIHSILINAHFFWITKFVWIETPTETHKYKTKIISHQFIYVGIERNIKYPTHEIAVLIIILKTTTTTTKRQRWIYRRCKMFRIACHCICRTACISSHMRNWRYQCSCQTQSLARVYPTGTWWRIYATSFHQINSRCWR